MNCYMMKMFIVAVIFSVLFSTTILHAEMKIILKDGKIINVPVSSDDIASIEYKNGTGPVQEKVFAKDSIRIQSAKYGNVSFELGNALGYKQYFCNARDFLITKCEGSKNCKIIVGSQICGDPYPGKGKYLYVEYTCGNEMKRAKNTQTEVMKLHCP